MAQRGHRFSSFAACSKGGSRETDHVNHVEFRKSRCRSLPSCTSFYPASTFSKALARQSSKDSSLQHSNRLKTQLLAWTKSKRLTVS